MKRADTMWERLIAAGYVARGKRLGWTRRRMAEAAGVGPRYIDALCLLINRRKRQAESDVQLRR